MLHELKHTRQLAGENRRRWFTSPDMDLIVWFDAAAQPVNFELCYDKHMQEKSLRWSPAGISHSRVDSGETSPGRHKCSPVHVATACLDAAALYRLFQAESSNLPVTLSEFVLRALHHLSDNSI
jgi:hypothetical protein